MHPSIACVLFSSAKLLFPPIRCNTQKSVIPTSLFVGIEWGLGEGRGVWPPKNYLIVIIA